GSAITSATLSPVTGTAVASVTAPTTSVTGLNPGATSNLIVPAFDPAVNPTNTRFAFANNSLTTTGSGAVNLVNVNTPTPTITLTKTSVVSGTVPPPQTVVTNVSSNPGTFLTTGTSVTAPQQNNFLTSGTSLTAPQQNNFLTSGTSLTTPSSNAI